MRHVLPSRRMCAAENPHVDRECLHPCDNVGDLLYSFFDELAKNCRQDMFAASLPGPSSCHLDGRRYQQIALT